MIAALSTTHLKNPCSRLLQLDRPQSQPSPNLNLMRLNRCWLGRLNFLLIRTTHSVQPSLTNLKSRILSRTTNDLRILSTLTINNQQLKLAALSFSGHRYSHVLTLYRSNHPMPILSPSKITVLTLFRLQYSIQLIEKLKHNLRLKRSLLSRLSKKLPNKIISVTDLLKSGSSSLRRLQSTLSIQILQWPPLPKNKPQFLLLDSTNL